MITDINSFGCSFTLGTDLQDFGVIQTPVEASKSTWPALIAHELGMQYHCIAGGGTGNLNILRLVLQRLMALGSAAQNSFWIINWTFIDRFDYQHNEQSYLDWNTIRPGDTDSQAQWYYRYLHSEPRDKLTSLINIYTAIDVLQREKVPFMMTCIDDLLLCKKFHHAPAIAYLQDFIAPWIYNFDGSNFLDWSRKKNFPISSSGHPLEQAHVAAAELMSQPIDAILHKV